jgi:hypothetical protein
MLRRAAVEAESLSDQALANDLHSKIFELEEIHVNVVKRGRRYQSPSATVRI